MDPNTVVLEISSDEEVDWNDKGRRVSDGGDDDDGHNWLAELLGDEVVVVKGSEKPVKKPKPKSKSSVVDLDDDCVVLDEDPNAAAEVRDGDSGKGDDDSDEIVVVSEKGQVACRDYPHSRHLCIKFPFSSTPNQSHCNQCYCYVCDSLAPCAFWGNGSASSDHCHATDKDEFWKHERKNAKNGGKAVQPIPQLRLLPTVNPYPPASLMVQSPNQIPNPSPISVSQYRNNILAWRNKLHPDLVSQLVSRAQQRHNVGSRVHRPVFKRTHPVISAATRVNQNRYGSYRGNLAANLGNPIRQPNYQANGSLSASSKYLGSLQPSAVNASVPYPPRSQTFTSSTVNQPEPQFPNFETLVNSNPIPEYPLLQQVHHVPVPPSSSQPQPASSQQTYMVPSQPSYHVPSKTQLENPLVPVSNFTQNASQGNQSQGPIVDSGFKDYGLGLPTGQDSGTLEGVGSATNGSSLAETGHPGVGLADYQFDWIFDNQPIEPGFTDYSSDSAFIGPIFDF